MSKVERKRARKRLIKIQNENGGDKKKGKALWMLSESSKYVAKRPVRWGLA